MLALVREYFSAKGATLGEVFFKEFEGRLQVDIACGLGLPVQAFATWMLLATSLRAQEPEPITRFGTTSYDAG